MLVQADHSPIVVVNLRCLEVARWHTNLEILRQPRSIKLDLNGSMEEVRRLDTLDVDS